MPKVQFKILRFFANSCLTIFEAIFYFAAISHEFRTASGQKQRGCRKSDPPLKKSIEKISKSPAIYGQKPSGIRRPKKQEDFYLFKTRRNSISVWEKRMKLFSHSLVPLGRANKHRKISSTARKTYRLRHQTDNHTSNTTQFIIHENSLYSEVVHFFFVLWFTP